MKGKIIAILGPTASGKSDWAVKIAKKIEKNNWAGFKGSEIISADSRQVYKGMDIGSGKITKKEMKDIPHHLLSIASPKRKFTFAQYKKIALEKIEKIIEEKKVPIICGGTLFYIYSLLNNLSFPEVRPDWDLRKRLEKETAEDLFKKLKKLDKKRALNIDKKNKRRLIRAIEVVSKTKKPVKPIRKNPLPYPLLKVAIKKQREEIEKLIEKRLSKRIKKGMIKEVKKLHDQGVSFKRLEEFGLEYKWISKFLKKEISEKEMKEKIQKSSQKLAKNQIKILEKDKDVRWFKEYKKAEKEVKKFLLH